MSSELHMRECVSENGFYPSSSGVLKHLCFIISIAFKNILLFWLSLIGINIDQQGEPRDRLLIDVN